jgi:hypothetical protein
MFMMMDNRAWTSLGWNFLYFYFKVIANIYNSSFKSGAIHWRPFSSFVFPKGVSNVCYHVLTIIKSFERKTKDNGNYVLTRTRGSSSQIWHEVKSIEVRHWSEVVCVRSLFGFFFNVFTTLCNASMSMSSSLTRNVNERHPSGSVVLVMVIIE